MTALARARYRARQFFGALRPRIDPSLQDEALAPLSDGERALFTSMTPRDQQHCLDVYERLRNDGQDDRDLLTAALLHDAGKGRIVLWHRVAYVVTPHRVLDRIARPGDGPGWRQTFYRCLHHEALGAELARRAGSNEQVISLIRGDGAHDPRVVALHAADDMA
ncbi:MAG: HD domain-containing protein [Dehalococcoidia bacterium]